MSMRATVCGLLGSSLLLAACAGSTSGGSSGGGSGVGTGAIGAGAAAGGSGGGAGASSGGGTGATSGGGAGGCIAPGCGGAPTVCCDSQGTEHQPTGGPCTCWACPGGTSPPPSGWWSTCPKPGQCSPDVPCDADEFCDMDWDAGDIGACKKRPTSCAEDAGATPDPGSAVCACKGKWSLLNHMVASECVANLEGFDVCPASSCVSQCGSGKCLAGLEYCQYDGSVVSCKPIPAACPVPPSCECLASQPCGSKCENDHDFGIYLGCTD